eukprot:augustus_masked-scaffold_3-processed-gene-10.3-mRNA-1 protein AED:1.00 eAED:1.00 QI:0/-1/0/0/-1/1/1/0/188
MFNTIKTNIAKGRKAVAKKLDDFEVMCPVETCRAKSIPPKISDENPQVAFNCVSCGILLKSPDEGERLRFKARVQTEKSAVVMEKGVKKVYKKAKEAAAKKEGEEEKPTEIEMQVTVPPKMKGGDQVAIMYENKSYYVIIPQGLVEGNTFVAKIDLKVEPEEPQKPEPVFIASLAYNVAEATQAKKEV